MLIFSQVYYIALFQLCKQFHKHFTKNFFIVCEFFLIFFTYQVFLFKVCEIYFKYFLFHKLTWKGGLERKEFTGKRLLQDSNNTSFDKEALFLLKNALFKSPFINNFLFCC